MPQKHGLPFACLFGLCLIGVAAGADEPSEADLQFFETKIRPLLLEHCAGCHGAEEQESKLRLDTFAGMLGGGISGPAIVPGNVEESLILAAVSYKDEALQMPPDGKLPDAEVALLKEWIARGAPHPEQEGAPAVQPRKGAIDLDEARRYWAFQPIVRPDIPVIADADWAKNPIDALVLAHLRQHGLQPAPPADRRTLIRRATFDLTGLPPTPEEIAAFLQDESPQAFAKVIDRLLESQHYGERWGRHWLDVARYADSNGLDENVAHGNAWKYRDWVIRSFNNDKPFDQFIVEQIAGDLLAREESGVSNQDTGNEIAENAPPASSLVPRPSSLDQFDLLIATGFLSLGPKVLAESDKVKMQMDIIDEQIDTIGRALLGLTLGCARCHDHKFDPISTDDYYALAGIFTSTKTMESYKTIAKWNENVIATPEELETKRLHDESVAAKQAEIQAVIDSAQAGLAGESGKAPPKVVEEKFPEETKTQLKQLRDELKQLEAAAPELQTAMGMQEGDEIANTRIHVRGSHLTLGRTVDRGVPVVLTARPLAIGEKESGRLQLAHWLVDPANPLTARVMVNRLWRWHFGRGIVPSVDNFGNLGERPINPQLLDWLAAEFIDSGWSVKTMHRWIMLSNTYQMSSQSDPDNAAIDPDNRQFWRADVRRIEAEAIRDALLAVSGRLDGSRGGSLLHVKNREFIFNHTSKDDTNYDTNRRSVYLPVIRNNLYDGFSLFDYTTADVPNGDRQTSTVAPQALFMLNSELLLETSAELAARLFREVPEDEEARVQRLYELALGRKPETHETDRLLGFVARFRELLADGDDAQSAWAAACHSVLASNEFVYVK